MEDSPAQRWSLRFVDPSVERRYRDDRGPAARRLARLIESLGAFPSRA